MAPTSTVVPQTNVRLKILHQLIDGVSHDLLSAVHDFGHHSYLMPDNASEHLMSLFHGRDILEREVIRSVIKEKYQPIQKKMTYLLSIPPFPIPWSLLASRFFFGDFLENGGTSLDA